MRAKSRWGRLPSGLVGALALVVAVESALLRRGLDFINPEFLQYRATARACAAARGAPVLCFGDSLVKMGVVPRVLDRQPATPSYNLALVGSQPTTGYYLLRRALDAGARPETILVGFSANIVQADPLRCVRGLHEMATPGEVLDLAWTARDPELFATMALARLLPSYRRRVEVRARLQDAFRGVPPTARETNRAHQRNWARNRGSQINPAWPRAETPIPPALGAILFPERWACDRLNALYIKRFLQLAEARGCAVRWLIPPLRPDVQARREALGLDAQYVRFVARLQVRFPRLVVIDGRHAGYDRARFSDPVHLDRRGALAFSAGLAEILARPIGPRWVDLPRYREPSDDRFMIEDMEESRLAVSGKATQAR